MRLFFYCHRTAPPSGMRRFLKNKNRKIKKPKMAHRLTAKNVKKRFKKSIKKHSKNQSQKNDCKRLQKNDTRKKKKQQQKLKKIL